MSLQKSVGKLIIAIFDSIFFFPYWYWKNCLQIISMKKITSQASKSGSSEILLLFGNVLVLLLNEILQNWVLSELYRNNCLRSSVFIINFECTQQNILSSWNNLSKVSSRKTRKRCEICSKVAIKTPNAVTLSRYLPPVKLAIEYFSVSLLLNVWLITFIFR